MAEHMPPAIFSPVECPPQLKLFRKRHGGFHSRLFPLTGHRAVEEEHARAPGLPRAWLSCRLGKNSAVCQKGTKMNRKRCPNNSSERGRLLLK